MFRIPYYYPTWEPGTQIPVLGEGGPQSHMALLAQQPVIHPIVYGVTAYGLGNMPRQVIGPTTPIDVNVYSNPPSISNLEIAGLFKRPF